MVPSIRVNLMKYGKARSWLDPCFHACVEGREERERVLSVFGRIKPSSVTILSKNQMFNLILLIYLVYRQYINKFEINIYSFATKNKIKSKVLFAFNDKGFFSNT